MSILCFISYKLISGSLSLREQVGIREQRRAHIVIFEFAKNSHFAHLREPLLLFGIFKLLDEIFVVHGHHALK